MYWEIRFLTQAHCHPPLFRGHPRAFLIVILLGLKHRQQNLTSEESDRFNVVIPFANDS